MADQLELHEELCKLLGSRNVYFQPPESVKLNYPCIVYSRSGFNNRKANNKVYMSNKRYEIIVIERDPDSNLVDDILNRFPLCSFDRPYTSDNLYHNVLTLYY